MTDVGPNPVPATPQAAAGWYDDGSGKQRWWDGTQWGAYAKPKAALGTWAIALGAAGILFALIPHVSGFGIFLAVVALILGIIGLVREGSRALLGTEN